jgi:2-polyprenyl-6-hydroxyphenyl methylase/3-demethylubiquinone-9 3-methyltransferase
MIEADLCIATGPADGDLVLCQATLEHVADTAGAIHGLASFARPGGRIAIFVPCRNAPFAILNRLLPERWKQRLLFALFPSKATGHDGFPAFYDRCTPTAFAALGSANGLQIAWQQAFWTSSYFYIFVPAYLLWRVGQLIRRTFRGDEVCETFAITWRKG